MCLDLADREWRAEFPLSPKTTEQNVSVDGLDLESSSHTVHRQGLCKRGDAQLGSWVLPRVIHATFVCSSAVVACEGLETVAGSKVPSDVPNDRK